MVRNRLVGFSRFVTCRELYCDASKKIHALFIELSLLRFYCKGVWHPQAPSGRVPAFKACGCATAMSTAALLVKIG